MAKNDNPHAVRFEESLEKHGEQDHAVIFSEKHPLSKSATVEVTFVWAQQQCAFLSEHFDNDTVKYIRMDCTCGPEFGKRNKLKNLYEKEKDLGKFVEKANKTVQGFSLQYDGEFVYLIYPQCYCSCVKRIDTVLPATWCYCTLGYTKKMFEHIFETKVQTELLSSVKQGDPVCRIRIKLCEESD